MHKLEQLKEAIYPYSWVNGSYRFTELEIKLKETASLEDLMNEKEEAVCFVTLVHEYIHYIQNFTTTWGFTNFITYIDLINSLFVTNHELLNDPELPLVNLKTRDNKTYSNFIKSANLGSTKGESGKYIFTPTTKADFTLFQEHIFDPYWNRKTSIYYLAYKGEAVPLNAFVISENMAIIGSYLASGVPIEDAKQSITRMWNPEYNIIYSYIYNLFPSLDCFKLTYYMCEAALLVPGYSDTIYKILRLLKQKKYLFKTYDEDDIIKQISEHLKLDLSIRKMLPEIKVQIQNRIDMYEKNKKDFGFFSYIIDILSLFKEGFNERFNNVYTYRSSFDFQFLDYFSQKIKSPVIVFADNQKTMLGKPTTEFIHSVAYFGGVLKTFNNAYFNDIGKCPFYEDHSICTVVKGIECKTNAMNAYNKEAYCGCLMNNALNIIGIKKLDRGTP